MPVRQSLARARAYASANPNVPEAVAAFAIKLIGAGLSFGFSFMVARFLGAAVTGRFALTLTTATVASTVALFGLDYLLLRTMAGSVRAGDTGSARGISRAATRIAMAAAILVGLLLGLGGDALLNRLLHIGLAQDLVLVAAVAVLPVTFNRLAISSLRGSGRVLAAQLLDGPLAMLMSVAILGGFLISRTPIAATGVSLLYFGMAALSSLAAWWLYARAARGWGTPTPFATGPLLHQGWKISFIVLSRMLLDWIVLLSLGAYESVTEVGHFRTAWQITSLIALVVTTFDTVTGPRVAAAWAVGRVDEIRKITRQAIMTMLVLSSPLLVLTLIFPEFVLGLFGAEFVVAAPALRILALGQLCNVLAGSLGSVLLMTGEEKWSARLSLAGLIVMAVLCVTLIPAYGIIGAALTTSLTILFRNAIYYVVVQRKLGSA
ncbi:MAG: hypothetical protein CFE37_04535 [Alphaproteobacteria bacterium PA4]|nr:MAG: hypothetical protein CFE37_04535 [Alphaproteobacteria bacterium PA4]